MKYAESQQRSTATIGQVEAEQVARPTTETTVFQCLVLSASQSRREMLTEGATQGGWDTIVCADATNARSEIRQTKFRLALVDLEGYGDRTPDGFKDLCEQLSAEGDGLLLAACGHQGDVKEEIWARQLGVWLFLPGVTDSEDVSLLCEEAHTIVNRMSKPAETVGA